MEDIPQSLSPPGESQRIKAEIARFIREDRLQPKLDKLKDGADEARQKLLADHQPATWIAEAARQVEQIQQVTHPVKFSHPQARGATSVNTEGNLGALSIEVGTHNLGERLYLDVACADAKYLPTYKFLCLVIDGRSLLERAIAADPDLAAALSDDRAQATEWMEAFARLPEPKGRIASHKLAKQLYWPVGDGAYHLLAPLLSSPLAHAVHKRISEDRFSDAAKAARDARRAGKAHPEGYRDYPNLVIQSFGGSKPQNISQLNSERRGENYLLASVPPVWESPAIRPPLKIETVFSRYFERRREVRRLSDALKDFLRRVADSGTNIRIRETRADLVAELCGEALHMAAELRTYLAPGWTAGAECQLNLAEQCWLDPARGMDDEDFAAHGRRGDWKDEVCLRFGNWLNARLQTDKTHFGGPEALAWQSALGNELKLLREELDDE
ncbi:MAG: type I-F CRISPR-associated protein Csy1 [Lysobacteraceae bacterium]|nr:MAG: type I-F CRISPR-associated protein Csy1 [Xanthomonadaceae bacterium]